MSGHETWLLDGGFDVMRTTSLPYGAPMDDAEILAWLEAERPGAALALVRGAA